MKIRISLRSPRGRVLLLAAAGATLLASTTFGALPIGLSDVGARILVEEGTGPEGPGDFDNFGAALVTGDFNGDGVDDLVTGIPGNDCDSIVLDCGATVLRLGIPRVGLASTTTRQHQMAHPGVAASAKLGSALAAGDFNADGRDDLAIGMPGYGLPGLPNHGAVQIHFGDNAGLTSGLNLLRMGFDGLPGPQISGDRFGAAVASGDFDGDGFADLAIGAPSRFVSRGTVVVAHGSAGGHLPFRGFEVRQGLDGLPDTPEANDNFGYALAAGDFNGDGYDDLAIGVPGEDNVGAVLVVMGSPSSLLFNHYQYFGEWYLTGGTQTTPGSFFGATLAVGDFDDDGYDDLAVGAPFYNIGAPPVTAAGMVAVVSGSEFGLTPQRVVWLSNDAMYGVGASKEFDELGGALVAGDFNGDGVDDLAIGVRGQDFEGTSHFNTGAVTVLLGERVVGFNGTLRQLRPTLGNPPTFPSVDPVGLIPDHRLGAPRYGSSLAAGDFDGNGAADLAIGAPGRDAYNPYIPDSGAVAVLYGWLFADGFETGNTSAWGLPALTP